MSAPPAGSASNPAVRRRPGPIVAVVSLIIVGAFAALAVAALIVGGSRERMPTGNSTPAIREASGPLEPPLSPRPSRRTASRYALPAISRSCAAGQRPRRRRWSSSRGPRRHRRAVPASCGTRRATLAGSLSWIPGRRCSISGASRRPSSRRPVRPSPLRRSARWPGLPLLIGRVTPPPSSSPVLTR